MVRVDVFKHRQETGQILAALLSAALLCVAIVCMQRFSNAGGPAIPYPHESAHGTTGAMVLYSVIITMWAVTVYYRCNDAVIRRNLMAIVALLYVWIIAALVKYAAQDDFVVSMAWYSFYVPNVFAPLMALFNALHSSRFDAKPAVRALKYVLFALGVVLIVLVYTNNLHHWAFRFTMARQDWDTVYTYGPVYWAVFAWMVGTMLAAFFVTLVASRPMLRSLIAVMMSIGLLTAGYATLYAWRVDFLFSTNVPLTFTTATIILLEICLQIGIIPSFLYFDELFRKLPLDLKLLAPDRDLIFRSMFTTNCAQVERPEERGALLDLDFGSAEEFATFKIDRYPNDLYKAYPIRGGVALLTEDATTINAEAIQLEQRQQELERQIELLEQDRAIRRRLYRQQRERELYASVEGSLRTSVEEMQAMLDELPQATTPEGRRLRKRQLVLVKHTLAYCKRKGSLVLAKTSNTAFDRDRLMLVVNEMMSDVRVAGVECAAIVEVDEALPAHTVNSLYDALYGFAHIALQREQPVLMVFVQTDEERIDLRMSMECEDRGNLLELEGVRAYRNTLNELDVAYALSGSEGELKLTVHLPLHEEEAQ